jgi:hypothetical protein
MTEQKIQDALYILLQSISDNGNKDWVGVPIVRVRSFEDLNTGEELLETKGLVISLMDGSDLELTIKRR